MNDSMKSKLIIEEAKYFTRHYSKDITKIIANLVNDNGLSIMASNDIAGDPHIGVIKMLYIRYTLNGVQDTKLVYEGNRVEIYEKKPATTPQQCTYFTDIIIPSYNNDELTANCFKSIKQHTKEGAYRIIWIDNGSKDMSLPMKQLIGVNRICVHFPTNKGFVGAVNEGLRLSDAPSVCLLNNDTVVTSEWLEKLNKILYANKKLGIVGPLTGYGKDNGMDSHHSLSLHSKLLPADAHNWDFNRLNKELEMRYSGRTYNIDFVAFLCAVMKREVIDKVGLLDINYAMGMWDDCDYNRSAQKAGYDIALAIDTCIYHRGRSTFNVVEKEEGLDVERLLRENKAYLDKKWRRN